MEKKQTTNSSSENLQTRGKHQKIQDKLNRILRKKRRRNTRLNSTWKIKDKLHRILKIEDKLNRTLTSKEKTIYEIQQPSEPRNNRLYRIWKIKDKCQITQNFENWR